MAEIDQYKEREPSITDRCDTIYQQLVDSINETNYDDLNTLTDKTPSAEATRLYSLIQMATKKERHTLSDQSVLADTAREINPTIEAYNQDIDRLNAINHEQLGYLNYLQLNTEPVEHRKMSLFDSSSNNIALAYQDYTQARQNASWLKEKIDEEQIKLDELKSQSINKFNTKKESYNQRTKQIESIVEEKKQYQSQFNLPQDNDNKTKLHRDKLPNITAEHLDLTVFRQLDEDYSSLTIDIREEEKELNILKIQAMASAYDEFKGFLEQIETKKTYFEKMKDTSKSPKDKQKFENARKAAKKLHGELTTAGENYFKNPATKTTYLTFQTTCKNSIEDSKKVLAHHRGMKKILLNIVGFIGTLGIGYGIASLINIAVKGRFTFWSTDSTNILEPQKKKIAEKDIYAPKGPSK